MEYIKAIAEQVKQYIVNNYQLQVNNITLLAAIAYWVKYSNTEIMSVELVDRFEDFAVLNLNGVYVGTLVVKGPDRQRELEYEYNKVNENKGRGYEFDFLNNNGNNGYEPMF